MHFFNPVPLMPLLEVVRAARTGDGAVETAVEVGRRMGKEPIVVRDSPGFATSRLGVLLGLEAMRMLEEGVASAEDIDRAMTLGYRHPMGRCASPIWWGSTSAWRSPSTSTASCARRRSARRRSFAGWCPRVAWARSPVAASTRGEGTPCSRSLNWDLLE